jgi:hypothetical protein
MVCVLFLHNFLPEHKGLEKATKQLQKIARASFPPSYLIFVELISSVIIYIDM